MSNGCFWYSGWPPPHSSTYRAVYTICFGSLTSFVVDFYSPGYPCGLQTVLLLTCLQCWPNKCPCSLGVIWRSTSQSRDAATDPMDEASAETERISLLKIVLGHVEKLFPSEVVHSSSNIPRTIVKIVMQPNVTKN